MYILLCLLGHHHQQIIQTTRWNTTKSTQQNIPNSFTAPSTYDHHLKMISNPQVLVITESISSHYRTKYLHLKSRFHNSYLTMLNLSTISSTKDQSNQKDHQRKRLKKSYSCQSLIHRFNRLLAYRRIRLRPSIPGIVMLMTHISLDVNNQLITHLLSMHHKLPWVMLYHNLRLYHKQKHQWLN